ncbi:MAG TPA: undecaprenyldiphospho-muramoylpentapeptide beta-N-acetylglucosaminyltransferase [Segeticoccus sp.]|uniref:undecaprenyldiphospho-muramoylpentapeptide beta-N-acetylglucosaminyltransferase n=1 Tax=Segeticoccus sp. TaxID=2706531 RepID=UPI002D7F4B0F|nr:undecaprenyldiphospho-muramoylpentapeptide beta-N-acetylglucosaminyltransferase [Segeticoccus sp.]HET8601881.1 undecaprenyldiphospho-muramoylpentapeptide beta-N-acetylglucosaminyltransferase [Segeticoccus sp.]
MTPTSREPRGEGSLRSVVLAGGGSAGHVSPLLALADCLRRRHPDVRITVLGTEEGLEARLVPARGYELRTIPKVAFPRRPGAALARLPHALRGAVLSTGRIIEQVAADVVVGFGGYVSTPAYLAARRRGLPLVIHEQNARPGLANRLGARFTPHVATTFASTRLPHAHVIGMPLRREITTLDRGSVRTKALAHFGLQDRHPTLLVTGGSLGAQRLNDAFAAAVPSLRAAGVQVLHLTGEGKEFVPEPAPDAGEGPPYVVRPYADQMEFAYAAADLVVARAGANTVCELTAVGLPAVYVPLPVGNGEQRLNAADVVGAGGGLLVANDDVTPDWVRQELVPLLGDAERLRSLAAAAAGIGSRDADERLADLVEQAATAARVGSASA